MTSTRSSLRILLVEDDAIIRKLVTKVLERLQHQVHIADNGQVALDICENHTFDVVLMDMNMPIMDGLNATRHIRRMLPKSQQPYIIALTGATFDEEKQACLDAGMDTFLAKPVRPNDLRDALEEFVEHHQPATLPLIDQQALDELRMYNTNNQDMIPLLISMFLEEAPEQIANLKKAFAAKDAKQVRHLAHSLKSSAATLGAARLAQAFANIEEQAREDTLANISDVDTMLTDVVAESVEALNKLLK